MLSYNEKRKKLNVLNKFEFQTQDAPWKKEDIVDFQEHYAGKYHHYITIGYIIKNPEIEIQDEKGHFYLSEVPTYDQLLESDRKLPGDLERKTSVTPKEIMDENGIPTKIPVISGEAVEQDNKVCIETSCFIIYIY